MNKHSRVCANIDLSAVMHNMEAMHQNIDPDTKIMAVIKADGYGHGAVPIAKEIEHLDYVYGYAAATVEEGMILRNNGIQKPILILGYIFPDQYEEVIQAEICPSVFTLEMAKELSAAAEKVGKDCRMHFAVDTGMSRIGYQVTEEAADEMAQIAKLPHMIVEGIFTHFAASDETDKTSANRQYEKFNGFIKKLEDEGITFEIKHCANSAAVIDMPDTYKDMVRLGIAMYGMYPSDEVNKDKVQLKPALELKSHVTMVKTVPAGERVSYGGTFTTQHETKLATVSVGYGDGYPRNLSSKGYVIIRGHKVPIVGRVCMDQMMVDATSIPDIQRNDVVTLIGKDGNEEITVEEISALAGTFNYEFVCDLNKRIPRNYYYNGRYIGSHDYFHEKWNLEI